MKDLLPATESEIEGGRADISFTNQGLALQGNDRGIR